MRKTIIECVKEHAENTPDREAIITPASSVTYRELFELTKGYAGYLDSLGVKKGDIVLVKSSQSVDFIVIYLAIHLLGGRITALEKSIRNEGIYTIASQLNASAIISNDAAVLESWDCIYADTRTVMEDAKKYHFENYTFPQLSDPADILYTTGTTGVSKGVQTTHEILAATAENLIHGCHYMEDFMLIIPGPLNHSNPIRNVYASLINGNSACILNGMMNLKAFFDALEHPCKKAACCLPPSAIRMLLQLSGSKISEYADRIDYIVSSTAPYPEADMKRMSSLLPTVRLYNSYGSSESGVSCMYNYNEYPGKVNCVGRPTVNSEIIIVDQHDREKEILSSPDNPGLLTTRGPINMIGYVNAPELTSEYLKDGVVYTNDIAYKDEDGFVYILGRQGDVINVGGLKVAPTEVEAAALTYEGVKDCICIAVKDAISENVLKLLIVMEDGAVLDGKAMQTYLAGKLESYKVPRWYETTDEIARTYNGKLDRKAYREKV